MGATNYGNKSEKPCGVGSLLSEVCRRILQDSGVIDVVNYKDQPFVSTSKCETSF